MSSARLTWENIQAVRTHIETRLNNFTNNYTLSPAHISKINELRAEYMQIFEKAKIEFQILQGKFNNQLYAQQSIDSREIQLLNSNLSQIDQELQDILQIRTNPAYLQNLQSQENNLSNNINRQQQQIENVKQNELNYNNQLQNARTVNNQEQIQQILLQKEQLETQQRQFQIQKQNSEQQLSVVQRRIQQILEYSRDQTALTRLQNQKQELQMQINDRQLQHQRNQQELTTRWQFEILDQEDSVLTEAQSQLNDFIASLVELEKQLKEGEQEIKREIQADFESKSQIFEDAAEFHRSQARKIFWSIVLMLLFTGIVVYAAFFAHTPAERPEQSQLISQLAGVSGYIVRLLIVGFGRVAILLFCGFGLRYLTQLHSSHCEQAIIYRDRKAALGVIQNLLNLALTAEQRRSLLETLTTGYLNFERNAFHADRMKSEEMVNAGDNIKTLKGFVEVIRPLLDSLKKVENSK